MIFLRGASCFKKSSSFSETSKMTKITVKIPRVKINVPRYFFMMYQSMILILMMTLSNQKAKKP